MSTIRSLAVLFAQLMSADSGKEVEKILKSLGDFSDEVVLNETFGGGFAWSPVGGRTTNVSTIELATNSGRSIVERINNSIDALVESILRGSAPGNIPQSPPEAARLCFGRPVETENVSAWFDKISAEEEAQRLSVVVLDGVSRDEPRLDIFDSGVGIRAAQLPSTILSLNVENKIKIPYALGLFGQGGSSTLAFATYTLIASRATDAPECIGFTLIRRCELKGWKESCYAYLTVRGEDGKFSIPAMALDKAEPFTIYLPTRDKAIDSKLPQLLHGTLVRHFDYKLPAMANSLSSSQKNLYHALHYLLFDPMIPFRLTDLRTGQVDSRHMSGSRNRLMKLVLKSKEKSRDSRTELKHYRATEFISPPGSSDPCIGVEYWVIFSWRKDKDGQFELRSGTEQFADRDHPILFTYKGQNHGELTADPLRKIGLNLLSRHIVVNIDASEVDGNTKRELFTSTRENLKKSAVLSAIVERVQELLSDDERLYELEKELTDRAMSMVTKTASADVKKQVIRMLKDNGLEVSTRLGIGRGPGGGRRKRNSAGGARQKVPPLPTLPFPSVTRFEIVQPADDMKARLDESKGVLVETDADALFDMRGLIQIRCEPDVMEITHKTPLRGGRISWRFVPKPTAKPCDKGSITATISIPTPDGPRETIRQVIAFDILPALPGDDVEGPVIVPDIEILPISAVEAGMRETWRTLWPDVNPDDADAAAAVAYKMFSGPRMVVYYNTDFAHYKSVIERWKAGHPDKCKAFDDSYKTFVAFHNVMQALATRTVNIEPDALDKVLEQERAITATMIAKQSEIMAMLRSKVAVEETAATR